MTMEAFLSRRSEKRSTATGENLMLVQQPLAVPPPSWFTLKNKTAMPIESTNLWMSGSLDGAEVCRNPRSCLRARPPHTL